MSQNPEKEVAMGNSKLSSGWVLSLKKWLCSPRTFRSLQRVVLIAKMLAKLVDCLIAIYNKFGD